MQNDDDASSSIIAGALVVSCEHAGRRVPAAYRAAFRGKSRLLESHRGWDPGALELARRIARRHHAPLAATEVTRLLVECNRSVGHPRLFSPISRKFDEQTRETILARYYQPHRDRVEALVRRHAAARRRVFHLSVHSFTPVLGGVRRRTDVGVLYDPRRRFESALARAWRDAMAELDPTLRVYLNSPYRGWADGLTTTLRSRFPDARYAGIELEVNQRFVLGPQKRWRHVQRVIAESIDRVYRRRR